MQSAPGPITAKGRSFTCSSYCEIEVTTSAGIILATLCTCWI